MKIRCAWCRQFQGSKFPFGGKYDRDITDGICDECLNKYFPHHADRIRSITGPLGSPIKGLDRPAKQV